MVRMDFLSLRSSERGLKYVGDRNREKIGDVAPFVGAWIEMAIR